MNKKIIIADDEPDIVHLVKFFLKKRGYQVIDFSSGEGLIENIKQEAPDLVLLDVMMPGENGIEVCRKMKNDSELRDIPVIILSAKTQQLEVNEGLKAGADQYLNKPFNTDELLKAIEEEI